MGAGDGHCEISPGHSHRSLLLAYELGRLRTQTFPKGFGHLHSSSIFSDSSKKSAIWSLSAVVTHGLLEFLKALEVAALKSCCKGAVLEQQNLFISHVYFKSLRSVLKAAGKLQPSKLQTLEVNTYGTLKLNEAPLLSHILEAATRLRTLSLTNMILESPGDVKLFCSALGNMQDLRYLDLSGFAAPPNSHTSSFGLLGKALSKLRGLQEFRMADPGLNLMATAFGNARHWRLIAEPLAAMSELQLVDITGSVRTMADSDEFSRNVVTSEGAKKWAENMLIHYFPKVLSFWLMPMKKLLALKCVSACSGLPLIFGTEAS